MEAYLDTWDGQPMHIRDMIRAIHVYTQRRHFKYEDLLKALEARGFHVDPVTWLVAQTNLPRGTPRVPSQTNVCSE
jgi:hypothetical protein